jgi:ABC-type glycerol-3-phosphate transport system substrate-binding protein
MSKSDSEPRGSKFQKFGLIITILFYLLSCIIVYTNNSGGTILDPDVKVISFAHWQLEDGFREGYAEAIKQFEALKAKQGHKVKVIQTTVPIRGYRQWFMTQLISGNPADLMELYCSSDVRNQYFTPLSQYVAEPNPYNVGSPFANVSWKDSYIDGMNGGLDPSYSEYFGIGTYFHVQRLYVNLELLEKATGSRELPKTVNQWLEMCDKMEQYGKKIGEPIVPIGVRGFDKSTIEYLFKYYYEQLNGNLSADGIPIYGLETVSQTALLKALADGKIDKKRLLAAVDIVKKIGRYFGKGFTATDLEQTKFLFFTGQVGFFPEGTWNAFSMVNNSPFEVGIARIPIIGPHNEYYKYFTGVPDEYGSSRNGQLGIPKATKNFALALEFLQYITSWKISQQVMIESCKWPCPVKKSTYNGIMKHFEPINTDGRLKVSNPFWRGWRSQSNNNALNALDHIVLNDLNNGELYFWNTFLGQHNVLTNEFKEVITSSIRQFFAMEALRGGIQLQDINDKTINSSRLKRERMTLEAVVFKMRTLQMNKLNLRALDMLKAQDGEGE